MFECIVAAPLALSIHGQKLVYLYRAACNPAITVSKKIRVRIACASIFSGVVALGKSGEAIFSQQSGTVIPVKAMVFKSR